MYTTAAGKIGRRTLRSMFGLSQHYWLALQKYDEVGGLCFLMSVALADCVDCASAEYESFSHGGYVCSVVDDGEGDESQTSGFLG